jgi:hypothetical protein
MATMGAGLWRSANLVCAIVKSLFFGQEFFCSVRLICVIAVSDDRYLTHRPCRANSSKRDSHRNFKATRKKIALGIA